MGLDEILRMWLKGQQELCILSVKEENPQELKWKALMSISMETVASVYLGWKYLDDSPMKWWGKKMWAWNYRAVLLNGGDFALSFQRTPGNIKMLMAVTPGGVLLESSEHPILPEQLPARQNRVAHGMDRAHHGAGARHPLGRSRVCCFLFYFCF